MQRAEQVSHNAMKRRPERWLDENSDAFKNASHGGCQGMKDMKAHFLELGTGLRMCFGMNMAWRAMRVSWRACMGGRRP